MKHHDTGVLLLTWAIGAVRDRIGRQNFGTRLRPRNSFLGRFASREMRSCASLPLANEAAIHSFEFQERKQDVDHRDEPGDDGGVGCARSGCMNRRRED